MVAYRRILLKLSGEAFVGEQKFGLCPEATGKIAEEICTLQKQGCEVGVVPGGGNFFRGVQQGQKLAVERTPADQIGMLFTLVNGIALQRALIKRGCQAHLVSGLDCPKVAESYQWDRVMGYLANGKVVVFVGGIGHPYFTTDTNAALRACEIEADLLVKGTTCVDGVFDKDPRQHPDAKFYTHISFQDFLQQQLKIMDFSAVAMCMEGKIPIRVFNFCRVSLIDALSNKTFGTLISG